MDFLPPDLNALLGGSPDDGSAGGSHQPEDADDAEEGLQFDLSPEEVVSRIETCAVWLAQQAAAGLLPDFVLSVPSGSSTHQTPSQQPSQAQPQTRSLLGRHPDSAARFARLWAVLNACHEALVGGSGASQRELYYRLKTLDVFLSSSHLSEAVQDAVLLLRVPRSTLGIHCSSKGLVAGALALQNTHTGEIIDCAVPGGRPIPGNLNAIQALAFSTTAAAVLVVEKDTVFQQLAVDPVIGGSGEFIIVTGKGVPDVATRAFLSALATAVPSLCLIGVVDWNPSGVGILSLYRHGSRRMAESARYALPGLRWLGVRAGALAAADGEAFHPLTPRDRALIPGLKTQLENSPVAAWAGELDAMEAAGVKADIEAMYGVCGGAAGLGGLLRGLIQAGDWI